MSFFPFVLDSEPENEGKWSEVLCDASSSTDSVQDEMFQVLR